LNLDLDAPREQKKENPANANRTRNSAVMYELWRPTANQSKLTDPHRS